MSLKMVCSSQNLGKKIKAFNLSLEVFILFILTEIQIILERKKGFKKKNRKIIDSCLKVQDCFEIIMFQINQRLLQKTKFLLSITMSYPHNIVSRFLEVKFYLMMIIDNQKEQIKKSQTKLGYSWVNMVHTKQNQFYLHHKKTNWLLQNNDCMLLVICPDSLECRYKLHTEFTL